MEYKINDYLTMKLVNGKTCIYINDNLYIQCVNLQLRLHQPLDVPFKSIDQMEFSSHHAIRDTERTTIDITPEEEFQCHCSNMQVWAEHDYDTNLLHRSLSFPLLKMLSKEGDPVARKVFPNEIKKRLQEDHPRTITFLLEEKYDEHLREGWFIDQMNDPNSKVVSNLIKWTRADSLLDFLPALNVFSRFLNSMQPSIKKTLHDTIINSTNPRNYLFVKQSFGLFNRYRNK